MNRAKLLQESEDYTSARERYIGIAETSKLPEEQWYCLYQIAMCNMTEGLPVNIVVESFLRAFEFRLWRVEPTYHLMKYLRAQNMATTAFWFAKTVGMLVDYPVTDSIFIEDDVYRYKYYEEMASCAHESGHFGEYEIYSKRADEGKRMFFGEETIKQ